MGSGCPSCCPPVRRRPGRVLRGMQEVQGRQVPVRFGAGAGPMASVVLDRSARARTAGHRPLQEPCTSLPAQEGPRTWSLVSPGRLLPGEGRASPTRQQYGEDLAAVRVPTRRTAARPRSSARLSPEQHGQYRDRGPERLCVRTTPDRTARGTSKEDLLSPVPGALSPWLNSNVLPLARTSPSPAWSPERSRRFSTDPAAPCDAEETAPVRRTPGSSRSGQETRALHSGIQSCPTTAAPLSCRTPVEYPGPTPDAGFCPPPRA